ncbi:hypothetical protein GJ629_01075 [Halapricum sp. CBA1109]|uniref:hypothetical protein n=1 Tax=Halapricum sp. CBA1109 TaxID=2668068 RepID=UPI0012F8DEFD|nr:hypothetical protein [Halapricum sp. CBA1109]MUV88647.1 hypothetical protein [Halapricum sp. CBA1109]
MTDEAFRYPNRGEDADDRVSRRLLLAGSAAAGVTATAGCSGDGSGVTTDGPPAEVTDRDTVFVFNTGEGTVSIVDTGDGAVVDTVDLGASSSFPSNQYLPGLTDSARDPLWLNVGRGVRALAVGTLSEVAAVDTGSGANWQELTPDGESLVVSAREPAHTQYLIDADRDSDSFGSVTAELDRTDEGGRGDIDGPGPCDVTVHPDGRFAYVPDLYGDTLTVLDLEEFGAHEQVDVPPVVADAAAPWMGTVAPDGDTLLVEHDEGADGTESVWDTSDPGAPEEVVRLTAEDGMGRRPLTSEVGPDSATGYVFTPGSEDVTVLDLAAGEVSGRIDLGGEAFVGTWDPDHERLYVPVQTADEVAVIDHDEGAVVDRIPVGSAPYGATAATVRPAEGSVGDRSADRRLYRELSGEGTTYCIGNCACGHQL